MKKFISLSIFAVTLLCLSQQQASAWCNVRFKAGVDFSWQCANSDYLWGMFRSGPTPNSYGQQQYPAPYVQYGQAPPQFQAPAPAPAKDGEGSEADSERVSRLASYPSSGYQSYYQQYYSGVQPVGYYYNPNYYYSSAPSYWYGY